jgi:hypothetical protein
MLHKDEETVAMSEASSSSISKMISKLISNSSAENKDCSMSVNPYDTAWIAMVQKSTLGSSNQWLFPKSFEFLLETQHADGSWYAGVSELDGLLSTMAALLALLKHQRYPDTTGCPSTPDYTMRISRAVSWLESTLRNFDFDACTDNVGFEILVPSLLGLLRGYGVLFDSSHLPTLMELAEKKFAKVGQLAMALGKGFQATPLHSLEAFIGRLDFDSLKGCKRNGGMLGSPSSTAAYLMHASVWDDEAEQYLNNAFAFGQGKGSGGIASAHPIEVFEMSWVSRILVRHESHTDTSATRWPQPS